MFDCKVMSVWERSLPFTDAPVLSAIKQEGPAMSIPANWAFVPMVALAPATVQKTFCARAPFSRWIVTAEATVRMSPI